MKKFTYGSVCSGIEAATCAWHDFAQPLWFSEIEPFPSAVLTHHFPDIPNLGDMTALAGKILNREIPAPDILVGGTPCQSWSIAGLRQGFDDPRGQLTLSFLEIANAIDYIRHTDGQPPIIIVWENVPGVLSAKGNAFGQFLAGLASGGEPLLPPDNKRWGNAGYIHAQRAIAWRTLDAQYFGVPQRRKRVFVVASARKRSVCEILFERKSDKVFENEGIAEVAPTLTAKSGRRFNDSEVIITEKKGSRWTTPIEHERLMGFPDDWSKIPYRNKPSEVCPDSPRYKAIGNSMAVPVMRWIGLRIGDYLNK